MKKRMRYFNDEFLERLKNTSKADLIRYILDLIESYEVRSKDENELMSLLFGDEY